MRLVIRSRIPFTAVDRIRYHFVALTQKRAGISITEITVQFTGRFLKRELGSVCIALGAYYIRFNMVVHYQLRT